VAGIAAGAPTENFTGGVAPEAPLLLVIPSTDVEEWISLGYSLSHSLALQYIRGIAKSEDLPVVINVSQGHNAGAHDGTSNLENGFDEITRYGQEPGIVVIKSAGNERDKRIHAKLKMSSGSQEHLDWEVKSTDHGRDVLELWFKASNEFKFRLVDPLNKPTPWITWSDPSATGNFPSGNYYKIDFTRFHRDNGDSQLIVWVSRGFESYVEKGIWSLEILSENVKGPGEIHAWLERNRKRPTAFLNHLDEEVTLSIPGTADHVISVSSVASAMPLRLSAFSSYGPTRDGRNKPDLAAPGEDIGSSASGSGDGIITMSGTSMAAPHVTGAIALLLSRGEKRIAAGTDKQRLNSAQIQAAIIQGVKNYDGIWNRGTGFGVLDIEAFFRVFGFA
jgi:endonuclease G